MIPPVDRLPVAAAYSKPEDLEDPRRASLAEKVEAVRKKSIYTRCTVEGCRRKMLTGAVLRCDCLKVICRKHQFDHGCLFVIERKPDESDRPQKKRQGQGGREGAPSDFAC